MPEEEVEIKSGIQGPNKDAIEFSFSGPVQQKATSSILVGSIIYYYFFLFV